MLFADEPLQLADAELHWLPQWLSPEMADAWLAQLLRETPWSQPQLFIHGRWLATPRQVAWYGDAQARYRYSGVEHQPLPWTPLLAEIRRQVEAQVGQPLNAVLLNLYRDGRDSMGMHADDEPELGRDPAIASVSFGATRRFCLRHRRRKDSRLDVPLGSGSLLLMSGPTQHHWLHAVPKTTQAVGERVNLTFRQVGAR